MKTINELFETVPKTTIAKDLGTNLARVNKMIADPQNFSFRDVVKIAALVEVDEMALLKLIYNQYIADKKIKKKR